MKINNVYKNILGIYASILILTRYKPIQLYSIYPWWKQGSDNQIFNKWLLGN